MNVCHHLGEHDHAGEHKHVVATPSLIYEHTHTHTNMLAEEWESKGERAPHDDREDTNVLADTKMLAARPSRIGEHEHVGGMMPTHE